MKKKTITVKNAEKLIKDKVIAGVDVAKKETNDVLFKVKKVAASANRKGKAAVRALKS
jgi:hypothetical protein